MIRQGRGLAGRIARYLEDGAGGAELYELLDQHIHVATAKLPDHYFQLGRRCPTSLASLSSRVLSRATHTGIGRPPFAGRAVFVAIVEDRMPDRAALGHLVYGRLSVMREVIAADLAVNLGRDPVGKALVDIYRRVWPQLLSHADRVSTDPDTWRAREPGPPHPVEDVAAALRAHPPAGADRLVPMALRLLGVPVTRSALTHLIAPSVIEGDDFGEELVDERELALLPALEEAVRSAWAELGTVERQLVVGLVTGEDGDLVLGREPQLEDPGTLARALRRVSERYVGRIVAAMGNVEVVGISKNGLYERIADATLRLLPELEPTHDP